MKALRGRLCGLLAEGPPQPGQEGSGSGRFAPARSLEPWLGVGGAHADGHLSWFLRVGSWGAFCPALPEEGHLAPYHGDHHQL